MVVDQATKANLMAVHIALMSFVWLGVVPLAIGLAMAGRRFNYSWWPKAHMLLMGIGVGLPLTVGAICAFVSAGSLKVKPHSLLGTIVVFATWTQLAIGVINHSVFKYRLRRNKVPAKRPWNNTVHIWLGRTLLLLAFVNIPLGMRIRKAGLGIFIGYAVWITFLAAVFTWLTWSTVQQRSEKPVQTVSPETLKTKEEHAGH